MDLHVYFGAMLLLQNISVRLLKLLILAFFLPLHFFELPNVFGYLAADFKLLLLLLCHLIVPINHRHLLILALNLSLQLQLLLNQLSLVLDQEVVLRVNMKVVCSVQRASQGA